MSCRLASESTEADSVTIDSRKPAKDPSSVVLRLMGAMGVCGIDSLYERPFASVDGVLPYSDV
jgi:hypothetical protein